MNRARFLIGLLLMAFAIPAAAQTDIGQWKELIKQGKGKHIIAEVRTYANSYPKNFDVWVILSAAYLQNGQADSAELCGRKAIAIDDERAGGYVATGKSLIQQKKVKDAYALLKTGLKSKPNSAPLLAELGQVLLEMDSTDQATIVFTQAKVADPNSLEANTGLGDTYMKQGVSSMAVIQYEEAVRLDSGDVDLQSRLAQAYMKEKRYAEAAGSYEKILNMDSTNAVALVTLGKLYILARQPHNAAKLLGRYLEQKPDAKEIWPFYMDALYASGQYKELIPAAEHVLRFQPNLPKALRYIARANTVLKNPQKVIDAYLQLEKSDTLQVDDLRQLSAAYMDVKNDSLAAYRLEEVLRKDSTLTPLYGDLGTAYMRLKDWEKAANAFHTRFTRDTSALGAYLNYSLCNMQLKNWEEAVNALKRVLEVKPDYIKAHMFLAQCYSQIDQWKDAAKEYEQVLRLGDGAEETYRDDLAEAHKILGVRLLIEKKYPGALEEMNKSLKLREDDCQANLWKAQTLQNMNKKEEAVRFYRKVMQLCPNSRESKEAKKGLDILGQ